MEFSKSAAPNGSFSYELSLLLSDKELSYGLFDYGIKLIKSKKLINWSNKIKDTLDFKSFLEKEGIVVDKLRKVKVGIDNNDFTLVPEILFSNDHATSYLKNITASTKKQNNLKVDTLKEKRNVYYIKKDLVKLVNKVFSDAEIFHLNTALLHIAESSFHTAVFVNFSGDDMHVIGIKNGTLHICQNYEAKSVLARLYYTMLVYDQLKWNTQTVPLYLAGNIAKNTELYRLYSMYIKEINYATCPIRFPDPNDLSNPSKHHFYAFYSVLKCAS